MYKELKKENQLELNLKLPKVIISMKKIWEWAKKSKENHKMLHGEEGGELKTYIKTCWLAYKSWKNNYMQGNAKQIMMPSFVGWAN